MTANLKKAARFWLPFLVLIVAAAVVSWPQQSICGQYYRRDKQLFVNNQFLQTEVATSPEQQTKGLAGRSCIRPDQAMLFVFDKPGYYPFWMRGMRFPIDIVWLAPNKQVVDVIEDLQPSTYPKTFTNSKPAQYIVELPAGTSRRLSIVSGTTINF
jgi:uncharacterized membrane protein (UPF0127 family)